IETGSYSKSSKLVTLKAMVDMNTLRGMSPLRELALAARWQMFSDPRLLADLDDASASFTDVWNPTEAEWLRYWRKNPINALVGGNAKTVAPWFVATDDALDLVLSVPDALGSTFDAMVREMVDYRLHRYLVGQATKRSGERRKPIGPDGKELDATFEVGGVLGQATSVLIHSQGGKSATSAGINRDYKRGLEVVLGRLKALQATLVDAYTDTGQTQGLAVSDRRLRLQDGQSFPLSLSGVGDRAALQVALQRSMEKVGQKRDAKGGNRTKRFRMVIELPIPMSAARLADTLALGDHPTATAIG
ncbi:MAG: hypothetical protein WCO88_15610, partial [Actinomycetota bacterium]